MIKIEKKEPRKGDFMKKIIKQMIAMNVIFALMVFYVFLKTGSEPSTLVERWFLFTSGEAGVLGVIKIFKIRRDGKTNSDEQEVIE